MNELQETLRVEEEGGPQQGDGERAGALVRLVHADDPRAPSRRWTLEGVREVKLGRASGWSEARSGGVLELGIDDPYASSRHLALRRDGARWLAIDEGSTNGTWVEGRRLPAGVGTPLGEGALLEVGRSFFVVSAGSGPLPRRGDDVETAAGEPETLSPGWALELDRADRLAASDRELLLTGESGSGKEVLARRIHARSGRRGPFLAVNCAALPETLLDDELFGHVKGAYSDAKAARTGLLRAAEGGTLLLDEVGEMSPALQAKLLRVLETRAVRPVGGEAEVPVDLRLLAATHRDLRALTAEGRFREDLLARLGLVALHVPAVRERREDLGILFRSVLRESAAFPLLRFELTALRQLLVHPWPLNVRELKTVLLAAVDLAGADGGDAVVVRPQHLAPALHAPTPAPVPRTAVAPKPLAPEDLALRARIEELLRAEGGNVSAVARALGKPRTHLQRLMARLGVRRPGQTGGDA